MFLYTNMDDIETQWLAIFLQSKMASKDLITVVFTLHELFSVFPYTLQLRLQLKTISVIE